MRCRADVGRIALRGAKTAGACLLAVVGGLTPAARAATYFWDGGITTIATTGDGLSAGGDGTWSTAIANWDVGSGSAHGVWATGNTAVFDGTAGTVTLGTAISAAGMTFQTAGYTLNTSANTLTLTAGIDASALTTGTTTLNQALIVSTNQTWTIGTGHTLALGGGISSGAGQLSISGGTTNFTGTALAPAKFTLVGGAVFNSSGAASIPSGGTYTGVGDGTSATLNVTAGSFTTAATLFLGNSTSTTGSVGTVNLSGGTITTTSTVNVGDGFNNGGNGTGVINISGGTFSTGSSTGNIRLGNTNNGSGTINLGSGTVGSGTLSTNAAIAPGTGVAGTGTKASVFNFNGGTLQALGSSLSIGSTVTANVLGGGAIVDTNGNAITLAASLLHGAATDGGLTKNGAGTLTLSGTNAYTGPTAVNAGVLKAGVATAAFGNNSALTLANTTGASIDITGYNTAIGSLAGGGADGGNVTLGAATLTVGGDGTSTSYGGVISGTGIVAKSGLGALTLNNANGFSGGLTIAGGTTNATGGGRAVLANATAAGTGTITINGNNASTGTLALTGGITVANAVTLTSSRNDPTTVGIGSGGPGLAHILNLSGNNTISASGFAIAGGGLGNILQSDADTITFTGSFSGNTSGSTYARPYFLTGVGNGVISGAISNGTATGGTSVVKYDAGTWALSGQNNYAAGTSIYGGTLQANNGTRALGTGTTTVYATSATLRGVLAGTGQTGGAVTVSTGTVIAGGVITAGTGATSADTAGKLTTGAEFWIGGTLLAGGNGITTAGGIYAVKFKDNTAGTATGTSLAGGSATTWDQLSMGALNLSSVSSSNPFNLVVLLASGGSFDTSTARLFKIAAASAITLNGTTNLAADQTITSLFALDTSGLNIPGGTFAVIADYNSGSSADLVLSYSPAPEPTTALLTAAAGATVFGLRRRGRTR